MAALPWQVAAADEPSASIASNAATRGDDAAKSPTGEMQGLEAFVDGVVDAHMVQQKIAGAQVAVVRDGRVLLVKGYGIDSIDPERRVDPARSLFRIGSISKTFTWLALMQLAERGELDLDDPVNDHLPDELDIADERFEHPIRIIDLMNHTPGFEDVLQHLFVAQDGALLPIQEHLRKYRPRRVREPGRLMSYSNYATALAGVIVAQVSGMEFESYVERNIFAPLGMSNTTFREEYAPAPGLPQPMSSELAQHKAQNLEWRDGKWKSYPHEHIVSMAPAGATVSTAADMAKYMMALLDPQSLERSGVLRQSTFAQLREPSFQGAPGLPAVHHGFFNMPIGTNTRLQFDNLSHNGATLHFMSWMTLIPDLSARPQLTETGTVVDAGAGQGSLGIFVTTNSRPGMRLAQALAERILSKYVAAAPVPEQAPAADAAARLAEYAGQYRSLRRSYSKFEKLLSLPGATPVTVTADGYLRVTMGGEAVRFVEVGKDLFRRVDGDATIAFMRDESGALTHLITPAALERVGFFQSMSWMLMIFIAGLITSIGVVVMAVLRRRRAGAGSVPAESTGERRSAQIMVGAAIAWLVFVAAIIVWAVPLAGADAQDLFVLGYPQSSVKVALGVLLVAAGLTLLTVASLVPVWREKNWSVGRRVRHSIAAVILIALVVTLLQWNVVGFRYF